MSLIRTVKYNCPKCKQEAETTIYDSINVSLDPDLKEKFMKGRFFNVKCPHCHKEITLPYGFIYHDMGKKLMFFFSPYPKNEAEEEGEEEFDVQSLLSNAKFKDYTYRDVHGEMRLREKIQIADAEFNDIAIEFIKLSFKTNNEELLDYDLYFWEITPENELQFLAISTKRRSKKDSILTYPLDEFKKLSDALKTREELKVPAGVIEEVDEEWMIKHVVQFGKDPE